MKPARIALFLQLCLLAGIAAAATPEQEMDAEARKMLPTLFSKCGEDHFSKRTFKRKSSESWIVGQYKDLAIRIKPSALSKADSLNGIQWKGLIQFIGSVSRIFPHDTALPKYSANYKKLDKWSEWQQADLASYFYNIEKRNGVINITRKPPMEITPVKCGEIPKG